MRRALHVAFPQVVAAARQHQQHQQRPEVGRLVVTIDLLAEQSLWYAQLCGALGRPPDLKEFGATKLRDAAEALETTPEGIWEQFAPCVARALAEALPRSPS